ncbi:MAG TPA: 2-dehydropantoate 2-reductase [Solirubrobacteraceae bacterium]|nr:2-dehydropantoate 2-reductase [Solirubrobacteraceae bacterium]
MNIAIVGAGAIGCAFGQALAGDHDLVLIDVWAEHVAAIADRGLIVDGPDGARTVDVAASTEVGAAADAEVILIVVKSFSSEAAARALSPVMRHDAIVVTVQNGIGNDARLAAVLGAAPIVQGSTTVGAEIQGPGHVRLAAGTAHGESRTALGRPADVASAAVCQRFAAALQAAGLPASVIDDVREAVWRKAVFAAAIGPLCATIDGTVADAMARPTARGLLRRAFAEIVAVARAEGIAFDLDEVWEQAGATYRSIGAHAPSLAVDVARGRPTEIDAQLGEIRRRGAAAGIPTPVCDVLAALIEARTAAADID